MKSPGRKTAALGNVITTLVSLSLAILDSACAQVNPADAPKMHLNLVNQMQNQLDAQIMRISQNPSNHDAYLQAAEIHHLLGNLEDAVALYQEVIGLGHDSSKPWYRMGLIFIEQGDLAKAEKMLTKSLLLTPNEQADSPRETLRLVREGDFGPRSGGNFVDYGPLSVAFVGSAVDQTGPLQMAMASIMQSNWGKAYSILQEASKAGVVAGKEHDFAGVVNNIGGMEHRHMWFHALRMYRQALFAHGGRIEVWHNIFQITRFRFEWGYFHDFFPQLAKECNPDLSSPDERNKNGTEIFGDMAAGASFLVCMSQDGHAPIIEFGTFRGRSTYLMTKHSKDPAAKVYTVDIGKSMDFSAKNGESYPEYVVGDVFVNFGEAEVKGRITQLLGDSKKLDYSPYRSSMGMVVVDGDHGYEGALSDIGNALDMVKPGGYVIVDDYVRWWPGVLRAVDELARARGLAFKYMIDKDLLFYHAPR